MWNFPTDPEEKRKMLLDRVESVREIVLACADESERISTLPKAAVYALEEAGLFALKLPVEFGGAEADPMTQIEIIEAMASYDSSAAWCMMIGATNISHLATMLPDSAVAEVFPNSTVPRAAGTGMPSGKATQVDGGYIVTGSWKFASGIKQSQWVSGGAWIQRDDGSREILRVAFPTDQVEILDDWRVSGLKGTGSNGFAVSDLFVPEEFTWVMDSLPKRGGPLYLLGRAGFVANEHAAFALGLGRRSLNTIVGLARSKMRGSTSQTLIGDRQTFHRWVGESDLRLRAAWALVMEVYQKAWDVVCNGQPPDQKLQDDLRGAATLATDVAVDVTSAAFRYGGGEALQLSNDLQRCHRDMSAAAQHLFVNDTVYESLGKFALDSHRD